MSSVKNPIRFLPPGPATPRYVKGERKGKLVVTAYDGHALMNPQTGKCMSKRQHWYTVKCDCGYEEVMNQAQLNAREKCIECTNDEKGKRISVARSKMKSSANPLPDFARMKLK